jgi:UPF0755 protein
MAKKKKKKRREAAPPPPFDREKESGKLARLTAVVIALIVIATAILFFGWYPAKLGPGPGQAHRFRLSGKESVSEITNLLMENNLVSDPRLFGIYFRTRGGWVAPGDHMIPDNVPAGEVIARLQRRGETTKITFPEGWTHFDMARRLEKQSVCDVRRFNDAVTNRALLDSLHLDGDSAEGFLFPATYDLPMDSDAEDVVRTLVKTFETRWAHVADQHQRELAQIENGMAWSRRQIVTLASMIEKEAANDEERPLVSSVFFNRLKDPTFEPKLLQSDPTAAYGCLVSDAPTCLGFQKITHDVLQDAKNPYNTYKHPGLPPGPIANPGGKSLEAAVAPATTKYLYFVAKNGRTTFSETLEEHDRAIKNVP